MLCARDERFSIFLCFAFTFKQWIRVSAEDASHHHLPVSNSVPVIENRRLRQSCDSDSEAQIMDFAGTKPWTVHDRARMTALRMNRPPSAFKRFYQGLGLYSLLLQASKRQE